MTRAITQQKSRVGDPLKEATIATLKRVVEPLAELMFDTGVTVHEFSRMMRETAVRTAARRIARENGRDSKSRVAIVTGLQRSEVARILNSNDEPAGSPLREHPARKVLSAWFEDPRFLDVHGEPDALPIFGKRRSFEKLVALHAGGIPVRAMLDELTRIDAVETFAGRTVRAKSRVPILTGLTDSAIAVIGERARDLLGTLGYNLRSRSKPLFEGTAYVEEVDDEHMSLIRREIGEQAVNFINTANSLLNRSVSKPTRSSAGRKPKCRLGVTVYYFQDRIDPQESAPRVVPRKNLRRRGHTKGRKLPL
jgi:hypothetical protein